MKPRYKWVLINHTFQIDYFYKRWRLLAEAHPEIDLTLIAPSKWTWGAGKRLTFGKVEVVEGKSVECDNFHIIPVSIEENRFGTWTSKEMLKVIEQVKPDLVYHIGSHQQSSLMQCLKFVKRNLPKCKMVTFSMRGPNNDILYKGSSSYPKWIAKMLYIAPKVYYTNKYSDAILCHYPDALESFKKEGYKGPIYMQTQVGVDTEVFKANDTLRKEIREKYNLGESYVFGSATRFSPNKGLDDILEALPKEGNWKFLMMGGGTPEEEKNLKAHIAQLGFEEKVILPGYVDWHDMAAHWNAVDCAIHTPRTGNWTETFSLAVVQAMATGLPIIGNTSGSVPYEIGPDGMIVPEQDIKALNEKITWVLEHPQEAKLIGKKMLWRAEHCFSIRHLNDCIYDIFIDICNGVYDPQKVDMATYKVNE